MLPKKNRGCRKDIEKIFKEGKIFNSPSLTFRYINTGNKQIRISFIAPKSIAPLAVKRNLLRRRGYSVLKNYITDFPLGLLGVFIFKKLEVNISILENEIKNILNKIN